MASLSEIVSKAAPILGAALGGFGAPIGMIVSGIASLFGGATDENDLIAKIKADPEAFLKLKQFEMQHEVDLLKFATEDRKSAREREASIVKSTGKRDWVNDFLSVTPFCALMVLTIFCLFHTPQGNSKDFFYMLFDMFSSFLGYVMGYHFGARPRKSDMEYFRKKDKKK